MIVLIESKEGARMHDYSQLQLDRHIKLGWHAVEEEKPPPNKKTRRRRNK